jgi:phosphopantothenoylcysteine decarboxylase/phosphopantothenate--cysteine ligase
MNQLLLENKQIILGVTGGIAAYKSADLVRRLREQGAVVRVVMTDNSKEFITPLTMQAVSGHPVHDNLFDLQAEAAMGHIELARWADAVLIAPATANCMARLARGEANDLLTTLCLATRAPVALAPAMNQAMWKHTQTQDNLQVLQAKGIYIFGPGVGGQACGDIGLGRMLEPAELVELTATIFVSGILKNKRVLITAGPTRESIDSVRFITNPSSGKMGYALAQAAAEAGAKVTVVSGPVALSKPAGVHCINVTTAEEMLTAVMQEVTKCDIFIGAAAVADFRCKNPGLGKIPKEVFSLELMLEYTPDIIAQVASLVPRPFVVGFAAQTDQLLEKAQTKLVNKRLDMIIANQINEAGIGFDSDENAVTVMWDKEKLAFAKMSKWKLAKELINLIAKVRSRDDDRSHRIEESNVTVD